ncbi:hypothetical protein EGY05_08050 [Chryseobacterium arthrosphaerae]|uniref:hypothetical protein n=1 Tax=Chryseobacterium arthrosphaerae TaxID=651561 RepID=UPI000F4E14F9|nr:hypothetical protein [Chryseobacterium arthrosphaerae]AYZ11878.1 hypothetical protein EGY05_08050 [Chryseobacterium arthrosphaerae]
MLNEQKRNNIRFIVFIALLCLQSCHAQKQHVKVFFEDNKKTSYQDCIKESEVDKIKKTDENREVIELMISGCKDRGLIFDNFMEGTTILLASLSHKEDDFIIYNWKNYSHYIPAPTVTVLKTDKTNVVEFTYYDEVNNRDDSTLRRKIYEEKDGKFKNELQFIQATLNGEKMDDSLSRYQRNDYYIIKRINGKYFYYTILNGKLETR